MSILINSNPFVVKHKEGFTLFTSSKRFPEYVDEVLDKEDSALTNSLYAYNLLKGKGFNVTYTPAAIDVSDVMEHYKQLGKKVYKPSVQKAATTRKKVLTSSYVFKFGKHQGKKVSEVPTDYLLWFEKNVPKNRW